MEQRNLLEGVDKSPSATVAVGQTSVKIVADHARELAAIQRHTGERFQPTFGYAPRFAGRLAVGMVVVEPNLGSLRVAETTRDGDLVFLSWTDDYGPCRAAGRYQAKEPLPLRVPGVQDRLVIRQQVDQDTRNGRIITADAARLIAIHLHPGPRSAMFGFAIDGAMKDDRLFDELNQVLANRPEHSPWLHAMARYLIARDDRGPQPQWRTDQPEPELRTKPSQPNGKDHRRSGRAQVPTPFAGKAIPANTVVELVDAAFQIGLKAASSKLFKRPSSYAAFMMRKNAVWRNLARQQVAVKQEWI